MEWYPMVLKFGQPNYKKTGYIIVNRKGASCDGDASSGEEGWIRSFLVLGKSGGYIRCFPFAYLLRNMYMRRIWNTLFSLINSILVGSKKARLLVHNLETDELFHKEDTVLV